MKKIIVLSLACLLSFMAFSQNDGINPQMLEKIKKANNFTAQDKALQNAITSNSIDKLVISYDNQANYDTYFSNRVKTKGVSD